MPDSDHNYDEDRDATADANGDDEVKGFEHDELSPGARSHLLYNDKVFDNVF